MNDAARRYEVDSCSACYANLVGALWRLREDELLDKLL